MKKPKPRKAREWWVNNCSFNNTAYLTSGLFKSKHAAQCTGCRSEPIRVREVLPRKKKKGGENNG